MKPTAIAGVGVVVLVAAAAWLPRVDATATTSVSDDPAAAFAKVARVLRHPRCLNCHTVTDYPRVGDDRRPHPQNVRRGPKDHGMAGLHCATCHQNQNVDVARIPGAPHWGLAPLSMGWEGLDDRELAEALVDLSKNGNRSHEALYEHMAKDPLVLWAWEPGVGRAAPSVTHEAFVHALETWFRAGAPLPAAGVTSY